MKYRVLLGGSYLNVNRRMRTSHRSWVVFVNRLRDSGFRIVVQRKAP